MVTPICDKCRRRNVVSFQVEPAEAWRTVVLNRWKSICPPCFDAEAERAGVRYHFAGVQATSWKPAGGNRLKASGDFTAVKGMRVIVKTDKVGGQSFQARLAPLNW
jgi:hypothetical protein